MPSSVYVTGGQINLVGMLEPGLVRPDGELSVAVLAFHYEVDGQRQTYAGSINNSLTDDSWNYVYLNYDGSLVINTTGFPTVTHIRLAKLLTQGGGIVTINDERVILSAGIDKEINQDQSESESSNSGTWLQKLRMNLASVPDGTYVISWSCELRHSNNTANEQVQMRVEVNDTTEIGFSTWLYDTWNACSGMKVHNIAAGNHTLDMDFQMSGGGTGYIRRARFASWRIA